MNNFVSVRIFFSSMIEEKFDESAAYSWLALMSDVGGAFGLILGSTVLTLFEFIDFLIISLLEYFGFNCFYRNRKAIG